MSESCTRSVKTLLAPIRRRWKNCPIPILAAADWEGTNHYEIHDLGGADWWWLDVFDTPQDSSTNSGKRLGAVLDYATYYRRDVGMLLQIVDGLCAGEINEKQLAALRQLKAEAEWSPQR